MSAFLPKFLEAETLWVMWHDWPEGQHYCDPGHMDVPTLWLMLRGEAQVKFRDRVLTVRENMVFLSPPSCPREVVTLLGAQWISVSLRATLLGHTDIIQLMRPPVLFVPDADELLILQQAMKGLHREWAAAGPGSGDIVPMVTPDNFDSYIRNHYSMGTPPDATSLLLADCYLRTAIAICWRHLGQINLEHAVGQGMPAWVTSVLQELRADPDIGIDQLAHDVGISPTQLRRQFQKWFGASPREYLNRLRLEDARQLLATTDLPVAEIAEHIGFLSAPHFNRLFKQSFGLPPAQYRQLSRISSPASAKIDRKPQDSRSF